PRKPSEDHQTKRSDHPKNTRGGRPHAGPAAAASEDAQTACADGCSTTTTGAPSSATSRSRNCRPGLNFTVRFAGTRTRCSVLGRSEEHTSELQSREKL